jgi:drug/metabolite transporter (DMT)-like permease
VSDEKADRPEVSLSLAAIFWGLNYAASKYAADFVPPPLLVTFRFALGGLLLLGIYLARYRCPEGQTQKGANA